MYRVVAHRAIFSNLKNLNLSHPRVEEVVDEKEFVNAIPLDAEK
jgi:hypothetical protein